MGYPRSQWWPGFSSDVQTDEHAQTRQQVTRTRTHTCTHAHAYVYAPAYLSAPICAQTPHYHAGNT